MKKDEVLLFLSMIAVCCVFFMPLGLVVFLAAREEKCEAKIYHGKVLTSHVIQPTFQRNWASSTGRARIQENGEVWYFYSRPNNIYEVGDVIVSYEGCGYINQELGRNHD